MADMPVNLDDVDRLERRGDIKGAINLCRDGLVGADSSEIRAVLHLRIGRCLLETELDEAADRLGQARREAEQAANETLLGRIDLLDARLASLRGRHQTAAERLASADRRLADSADDRIDLELLHAGAERQRGELTKALTRLQALPSAELEARPFVRAELLDEMGAIHLASGDFNAAIDTLTEAVALDHRLNVSDYASARSRLLLAAALLGRGDRRRSRQLIEEVRESFGGSTAGMSDVFALRGQWYEEGNEFSLAARDYRTGLDVDRDSDDEIGQIRALQRIARVRRRQGNITSAEESLEEAWNLALGNEDDVVKAELYMEEGELALDQGEYERAIDKFNRALKIATDDEDERAAAVAKRRLATARWENGELAEAETLLREAREVLERRGDLRELNDLLDDLGEVLLERDAYKDAIDVLNQSLEIDERLATISSRARSYALLSRAHLKQGDRIRAGEFIRKASDVYADTEDEVGRSDVLYDLGVWLHQEGRLREARNTFQDAFRLDSRHDDRIGVIRAMRGLGAVYRTMGDLVRARESLEEASELLKSKEDRAERAHLDLELGRLLAAEGRTSEAERTLVQARERFESIDSPVDAATCMRLLGRLYGTTGGKARYRTALELLEAARAVFEEYNDTPELDELYDDLGRIYLQMGRLADAQQAVEASVRLGVRDRWRGGQGSSLLLLGRINVAKDDLSEAKRNFDDALRLFEEVEDDAGTSNARLELGDLAVLDGEHDEALVHYRAARQIDQAQRDLRGLCLVFRKLGDVYFIRGEYERAEEAYDQADENLRWFSDKREEASLFHSRGILAAQQGDHSKAVSMFKKALTRFREIDDADHSIETYRRLATSYHALERFDEAIECLREMGLEQASIWHSLLKTFHADVAEAAVDRFLNQDFNAATQEAFKAVERHFRAHDESGDPRRAVGAVIREWSTPERRGLAPFQDKDELTNYANFCVGAFGVIRNRVVHGRLQLSSTDAMAALGVAHLISSLVEIPEAVD
jgi:tetratricopeptide (TPR) repeat protein